MWMAASISSACKGATRWKTIFPRRKLHRQGRPLQHGHRGQRRSGFNAADRLWQLGQHDIVLVTENRVGGTSRNTGSDKQTYYKLTLSGGDPDSVREMADTLFAGRCVGW